MIGGEVEAAAKATEEVARTTGKGIDAASGLGRFLKHVFGAALEEYGQQQLDSARFRRAANLLRLQERWTALKAKSGLPEEAIRPLPFKVGVELIEAASLEEDDTLRELFARLLHNMTDDRSGVEAQASFVAILRGMSGFDARVLLAVANSPVADPNRYAAKTVYTARLPDGYFSKEEQKALEGHLPEPPRNVAVALHNLARLGCVHPASVWGGTLSVGMVTMTALGEALIEACGPGRPQAETGG